MKNTFSEKTMIQSILIVRVVLQQKKEYLLYGKRK